MLCKSGDYSGSDESPESYNEEDSSKTPPTHYYDNETQLFRDVVAEKEEEEEADLWRQMAFAQESSKVTYSPCSLIDQQLHSSCSIFKICAFTLGNGG